MPPSFKQFSNTLNSVFANTSLTLYKGMSKRKSGLSEPYLSIQVSYGIRLNSGSSIPLISLKISFIKPSVIDQMSSSSTKLISISICENSG